MANSASGPSLNPPLEAKIEQEYDKFADFVDDLRSNISLGGMFLATPRPRPVGTEVRFQIRLVDGYRLLWGIGEVAWVRPKSSADRPAGMGLRFLALDENSRDLVLRLLEEQVKSGGEPFDLDHVPPDAHASPPPATGQLSLDDLSEDPTLIGSAVAGAGAAPAGSEAGFAAPWGQDLPKIPSELMETEPAPSQHEATDEDIRDIGFAMIDPGSGEAAADGGFELEALDEAALEESSIGLGTEAVAALAEPATDAASDDGSEDPTLVGVTTHELTDFSDISFDTEDLDAEAERNDASGIVTGTFAITEPAERVEPPTSDAPSFDRSAADASTEVVELPVAADVSASDEVSFAPGGPEAVDPDRETVPDLGLAPGAVGSSTAAADANPGEPPVAIETASGLAEDSDLDIDFEIDDRAPSTQVQPPDDAWDVSADQPTQRLDPAQLAAATAAAGAATAGGIFARDAFGRASEPEHGASEASAGPASDDAESGWRGQEEEWRGQDEEASSAASSAFETSPTDLPPPDQMTPVVQPHDPAPPLPSAEPYPFASPLPPPDSPSDAGWPEPVPSAGPSTAEPSWGGEAQAPEAPGAPATSEDLFDRPPEDAEPASRRSRWPLALAALLVLAIGGAAFFFRDTILPLVGLGGEAPVAVASAPDQGNLPEPAADLDRAPSLEDAASSTADDGDRSGFAGGFGDDPLAGSGDAEPEMIQVEAPRDPGEPPLGFESSDPRAVSDPPAVEVEAGVSLEDDLSLEDFAAAQPSPAGDGNLETAARLDAADNASAEPFSAGSGPPAASVAGIDASAADGGTRVVVRLDGRLDADRLVHDRLRWAPDREMVSILGVENYRGSDLQVSTAELASVRFGYHPGRELRLVFDLASEGARIADVRRQADRLEIFLVSP
ncbi:MAG: TIGR02266 family protein [Acidobacteriota bacterium]